MYPIDSNGAPRAIILAHELAGGFDPVSELIAYEHLRRPLASALMHANRQHGTEHFMTTSRSAPPTALHINR
jgi:hypothetical protein